jgi:hypothetical protein
MPAEVKYKFPPKLGACADRLYQLREKRLTMQKDTDAVEAEEKALKEHIIQTLPKSEAGGIAGKVARVSVVTKSVPRAEDWEKVHTYIKKTGSFDLLQRRLSDSAVQERWDAGKKVPGVEPFNVVTLSVNKV